MMKPPDKPSPFFSPTYHKISGEIHKLFQHLDQSESTMFWNTDKYTKQYLLIFHHNYIHQHITVYKHNLVSFISPELIPQLNEPKTKIIIKQLLKNQFPHITLIIIQDDII